MVLKMLHHYHFIHSVKKIITKKDLERKIIMEQDLIKDIFDGVDDPFEEVSKQEMKNELVRILPDLNDHEYLALSLHYEQEEMMSWNEIAEILELEESDLELVCANAMLKLNNKLSEYAADIGS